MPDSGAVYQPTTVGYTYDSGGDGSGGGGGGGAAGLRHGFWRIVSRHKLNSRKWLEWTLLSIALCFFVAGLTTMLVNLVSAEESSKTSDGAASEIKPEGYSTTVPDIQQHENIGKSSVALGAGIMLIGVLLGFVWTWLTFFHHSKSPRNGMTSSSGQMLGGLNPSTDLLVGSTSQYGPVLTEVPSQLKIKQANSHDMPAIPLSDQEEEMHTLMQDPASPPSVSVGSNTITNQIPG
ncbi:hypothetical protein ALC56_02688 [Trachymyrmex septentrionalis]|uniref:Uncharacterized protein n=1 Tax=Trachymyrmex septentrionalis TaxID=34720 RepID=A0A195FQM9_9HYME|nr:PREDICTED: uncharacterized protein LOC108745433 isoform X1 [Trachymyrmex septentrionalis]KYN42885.1 hypothetical protein ALC56_02688 [Trachymyrmex septentrionalis]